MRNDPPPDVSPDKSPHERFKELGEKLMAVPKSQVDAQETKWKAQRGKPARKKR